MDLDAKIAQLLQEDNKPQKSSSSFSLSSFDPKTFGVALGISFVISFGLTFILRPQYVLKFEIKKSLTKQSNEDEDEEEDLDKDQEQKIEVDSSIKWKEFAIFSCCLTIVLVFPIYKWITS
jgi:hypothetical protein